MTGWDKKTSTSLWIQVVKNPEHFPGHFTLIFLLYNGFQGVYSLNFGSFCHTCVPELFQTAFIWSTRLQMSSSLSTRAVLGSFVRQLTSSVPAPMLDRSLSCWCLCGTRGPFQTAGSGETLTMLNLNSGIFLFLQIEVP